MSKCLQCQKFSRDKTKWCAHFHKPVDPENICTFFVNKDVIPVDYLKTIDNVPYISYEKGKIIIAYNREKHTLADADTKLMDNDLKGNNV